MSHTLMSDTLKATLGILDQGIPTIDSNLDEIAESEFVEPAKLEIHVQPTQVPTLDQTDAQVDYVHARNITYTLLERLGSSLAGALRVADASEHPRAYECVNQLATTMRGLTQDLLGMQKTFKEVTKGHPSMTPQPTGGEGGARAPTSAADLLTLMDQLDRGELKLADKDGQPLEE